MNQPISDSGSNDTQPALKPDAEYDGGETGCGELLLDLLLFMKQQPTASLVRIRALDPGAPLEIPAWCRLTGHQLLDAQHPFYLLRTR